MTLSHSPNIVRDGLVLYLDAANSKSYPGSGTTWFDLSGNGNNGTLINGVGYSSDNKGSMVFDGVDDYSINSNTTNIPVGNSDRTIVLWVYPTTETNNFVQLGNKGAGTGQQVYIFEFYKVGSTYYLFTDGINAGNNLTISGNQLPDLNAWNFLVFGNSGQNWFYYKNATLKKSGTWSISVNTIGQQYVIGKRIDYSSLTVNGNISNVKVYNRAITESEIQQNFNATRGRYGI